MYFVKSIGVSLRSNEYPADDSIASMSEVDCGKALTKKKQQQLQKKATKKNDENAKRKIEEKENSFVNVKLTPLPNLNITFYHSCIVLAKL